MILQYLGTFLYCLSHRVLIKTLSKTLYVFFFLHPPLQLQYLYILSDIIFRIFILISWPQTINVIGHIPSLLSSWGCDRISKLFTLIIYIIYIKYVTLKYELIDRGSMSMSGEKKTYIGIHRDRYIEMKKERKE